MKLKCAAAGLWESKTGCVAMVFSTETKIPLGDKEQTDKLVCGSALYNTEVEMCCDGTVHNKSRDVLCCKDNLYNSTTHICCNQILRPKSRLNERISCCGSDPYDPEKSLCCNGIKHEKSSKLYGCCDTKPYRLSHDMCCISKVHGQAKKMQCCGTETFDRERQYCYNDHEILDLYEGKCGNTKYSTLEHVCCDRNLISNKKGRRCCGSSLFNPKVNDCDMKHIVQRGFLWCESGEYNPDTHDCCEGQLKKKNGSSWRCCGARIINYDVYGCCGAGHPYNKRNEQCCGGNIIKTEEKCCANQHMNSTQLCCGKTRYRNEEVIIKKEPYHDKCCPHKCGGISYDSVNSVCSWENTVIEKTKTFNICGEKTYNPEVDLCCNLKIFKKKRQKGMKCCYPSSTIYHPKTHFCENGEIKSLCPARCEKITLKNFCKKENSSLVKESSGLLAIRC
ncbi:galaxin-like [Saccostrea echinata]|uniref:galaxin-like n=1 Tax=Saccostrea echinata TaxID=191078 RepID=UPI002A829F60|nr:galaxin-like [Saccostrea echinata]